LVINETNSNDKAMYGLIINHITKIVFQNYQCVPTNLLA